MPHYPIKTGLALTLCKKSAITTITNRRKSQAKKLQAAPPDPRPIPRRRAAFCDAEGRHKPARNRPPKHPRKPTPKPPRKRPPKPAQNSPQKHPARTPPDMRQTITRRHPETHPAFDWVRTGSALGPDWVRTSFFGNSTTYRYTFQSTATHSNIPETRYNSTRGPSKTPPDPTRTQHQTHHQTPDFIGCPSCPYSFYIKDL